MLTIASSLASASLTSPPCKPRDDDAERRAQLDFATPSDMHQESTKTFLVNLCCVLISLLFLTNLLSIFSTTLKARRTPLPPPHRPLGTAHAHPSPRWYAIVDLDPRRTDFTNGYEETKARPVIPPPLSSPTAIPSSARLLRRIEVPSTGPSLNTLPSSQVGRAERPEQPEHPLRRTPQAVLSCCEYSSASAGPRKRQSG